MLYELGVQYYSIVRRLALFKVTRRVKQGRLYNCNDRTYHIRRTLTVNSR